MDINIKAFAIIGVVILMTAGDCSKKKDTKKESQDKTVATVAKIDYSGNYVSDGYAKREQGSDWVAVIAKQNSDSEIDILVRSRPDRKEQTCTFEGKATKVNDNTFKVEVNVGGKAVILFTFNDKSVTVSPEKPEYESALAYYCSGGATLTGTYTKINGPLN